MAQPSQTPSAADPTQKIPPQPAIEQELDQQMRRALADRMTRRLAAERAPRCQRVKVNGTTCGSPALRGKNYCYFHRTLLRVSKPGNPIEIPPLEDGNSIQVGIMEITRGILERRLDVQTARTLLYALRTANMNLERLRLDPSPEDVVLDIVQVGSQDSDAPRE